VARRVGLEPLFLEDEAMSGAHLRCRRLVNRPSVGVVVVLVQLLFDELNEVAACVVKDGHDSGADVGRRLRECDAFATAVPLFNSDEAFRTGSVRSRA
jgi:hypothetical protein